MTQASALDNRSYANQQLANLIEEITGRLAADEPVDLDAYAARYPEHAEQLEKLLPTLAALVDLGLSTTSGGALISPSPTPSRESNSPETQRGVLGDFRMVREVGRGGMGVVYEAEQISLGRRVALKVLPFAAVMDPRQLARFKTEAQAAAHLTHQNIVPVFGVGCERGVHYYAMQFIEGQTLAQVIGQLRGMEGLDAGGSDERGVRDQGLGIRNRVSEPRARASGQGSKSQQSGVAGAERSDAPVYASFDLAGELASGRFAPTKKTAADPAATLPRQPSSPSSRPLTPDPRPLDSHPRPPISSTSDTAPIAGLSTERSTQSPAYFRSIANLGIQAAEALDHAHERGVVHRDVKPGNLMLDASGNLWVTDFGLARIEADPGLTMTGDILGTLRYMSPEQALAKRVIIDHRSDIYSLGVTLYELLALRPAFSGRDRQEILKQIAFEEPKALHKLNPRLPVDLATIITKAMAKNPDERYATAKEMADDLRRFLLDKPIQAKRPSLVARARKWGRRHRAFVGTSGVAVAVFLVAAVVGLSLANVAISRERDDKNNALKLAQQRQQEAEKNLALAGQRQQEAESNLAFARDAVDSFFGQMINDRWLRTTTTAQSQVETMDKALQFFEQFAEEPGTTPASQYERAMAFYRVGDIQYEMANDEAATQSSQKAMAILENLVAAHPSEALYLHQLANGYFRLGYRLDHEDLEKGKEAYLRGIELFQELESRFGATWDESQHDSHVTGLNIDRQCGCFGWYRYVQAIMWSSISGVHERAGLMREAEAGFRKALALANEVADEFPQDYPRGAHGFHVHLGGFLKRQGLPGADDHLRQSEALLRSKPIATTDEHVSLAKLLNNLGKPEEALRHWQRALWDPTEIGSAHTRDLLVFLESCPKAQFEAFGPENAIQLATKAVELYPSFALNWNYLRSIALRAGGPERALSALQSAMELLPDDAAERWPVHLHYAWKNLGQAHSDTGNFDAAFSAFEKALQVEPERMYANLALAEFLSSCPDPEVRDVSRAAEIIERAVELEPNNAFDAYGMALFLVNCPHPEIRDPKRALQLAQEAVAKEPSQCFLWSVIGQARYRTGDWDGAIEALNKASELNYNRKARNGFFLAMAHHKAGNAQEARRQYDEALHWMQDNQPPGAGFPQSFFRDEAAAVLGIAANSPDVTTQKEPEHPPQETTDEPSTPSRDAATENSQGRKPLEANRTINAEP